MKLDMGKIKQMIEDGFVRRRIIEVLANENDIDYISLKQMKNDLKLMIKENNFQIKKEPYSDDKIPKIIELYSQGVSAHQLEIKYCTDKKRILKLVNAAGILRTRIESMRNKTFDEHTFDNINTKETAYWLGFLYADGWNIETQGCIGLKLKISDDDHIKKYIRFLGGNERDIEYGYNSKSPFVSYRIVNLHLSKTLAEYGCMQRKSFKTTFPSWLDPSLYSHFMRGVFDGDGCLSGKPDWSWSCLGTKELLDGMIKIIEDSAPIKKKIEIKYVSETNNNTYKIRKRGNFNVEMICDFLYRDAEPSIVLDRKYKLYLEIKAQNAQKYPARLSIAPPFNP